MDINYEELAEQLAPLLRKQLGLDKMDRRFVPGDDGGNGESAVETPRLFKSLGEQLKAVSDAGTPGGIIDPRLMAINKATGLSEGIASEGGYLVQTDFVAELYERAYETGEITRRCERIPISGPSNSVKINANAETSRAAGSRWGGVQGYWGAEAGTKTASRPTFRQIELSLKKLFVMYYATDELLQDVAALSRLVGNWCAQEIAFMVEDDIIRGPGAGRPLGILNSGCLITVSKETGQAATTLLAQNVMKMWARMWARSRSEAVWLINQDVEPQLDEMSVAVGTGGQLVYMPPGGLADARYGRLRGRPVIPVEYCATLGAVGDIILADLSQYYLAEKGGIEAAMSIHVRFVYDETAFRFVFRVDGQPAWDAALTPYQGSNTLSPFVVLEARS